MDNKILTWTIGYFNDGFDPGAEPATTWYTNWNNLGSSTYNFDSGFVWAMSNDVTPPPVPVVTGKKMWVFAYNNSSNLGLPGGEALLYTQDKNFPAVSDTFDIADSGDPSDAAFRVIWGQVDRNITAAGGLISASGGGVYTVQQTDSLTPAPTFEAQSATWAAVPETSSSLLGLLGAVAMMNRRRR